MDESRTVGPTIDESEEGMPEVCGDGDDNDDDGDDDGDDNDDGCDLFAKMEREEGEMEASAPRSRSARTLGMCWEGFSRDLERI